MITKPFAYGIMSKVGIDSIGDPIYMYQTRRPKYVDVVKTHCGDKYKMFNERMPRRISFQMNPSGEERKRVCKFDMVINDEIVGMLQESLFLYIISPFTDNKYLFVTGLAVLRLGWGYGETGMIVCAHFGVISPDWKPKEKVCDMNIRFDYYGNRGNTELTMGFKLGGGFKDFTIFGRDIDMFGEGRIDCVFAKDHIVKYYGKKTRMTLKWSGNTTYDRLEIIKDWEYSVKNIRCCP